MKADLERKLMQDFPHVFYVDPKPGRGPFEMFGIECGDGWYEIIREGAAKLEPLFAAAIEKDPKGFEYGYYRTAQLKEKYGTMRWYLSCSNDEMDKITEEAERKSETTCERCGKPGKVRPGSGWWYCACFDHAKPQDRDNLEILEAQHNQNLKEKNNE